jgi:hypothetical protein
MAKTSEVREAAPPLSNENSLVIWLLQSSVIVAFVTGVLYAFGANYEYRLLWQLGLANVSIDRSTSDVIYDGLIIVSSWFKTFVPYLILLIATALSVLVWRVLSRKTSWPSKSGLVILAVAVIVVCAIGINFHLRKRAAAVAGAQKNAAAASEHSVTLADGTRIDGFVVSSVVERTILIDAAGNTRIIPASEIKNVTIRSR